MLFEVLLTSDMRLGKALGLKWGDVDFKNSCIHVKRTLSRTNEGWKLEEPKTSRSRRTIPLPKEIMINEHKKIKQRKSLKQRKP